MSSEETNTIDPRFDALINKSGKTFMGMIANVKSGEQFSRFCRKLAKWKNTEYANDNLFVWPFEGIALTSEIDCVYVVYCRVNDDCPSIQTFPYGTDDL